MVQHAVHRSASCCTSTPVPLRHTSRCFEMGLMTHYPASLGYSSRRPISPKASFQESTMAITSGIYGSWSSGGPGTTLLPGLNTKRLIYPSFPRKCDLRREPSHERSLEETCGTTISENLTHIAALIKILGSSNDGIRPVARASTQTAVCGLSKQTRTKSSSLINDSSVTPIAAGCALSIAIHSSDG